jgi:PAS domain S-box-containing protein
MANTLNPSGGSDYAALVAQLEGMAPDQAGAQLAELASALFPGGVGTLQQTTWGERNDTSLPGAELRFRTLIDQIPAVVFMADLGEGTNDIYISPHIEALLGFTQKEWLEDPLLWYSQLHPADRQLWHDEFSRGIRTGGPFLAECRFIARDGKVVWVRGEARLVKDERGRPLFLQGVAFDITESKRAQAAGLLAAVRSTEEQYRGLVEGLGAIFWEADARDKCFTLVSQGVTRILGFTPEEWLKDAKFWLGSVHPDDRAETETIWTRVLESGSNAEHDFRMVAADGRVVWLHLEARGHVGTAGPGRPFGVMLDITGRKQAEDILRANEARLKRESDVGRTLHRIGASLASELDLERLVQVATDEATSLTTAQFGAFFYNVLNEAGESYMLYTLSGVPHEAFSKFPMPRNTALFSATFTGQGVVRLDDVTTDPRFGKSAPHYGMPTGHLPVRSYLAVPVVSRTGQVMGGMFFGHSTVGVFTKEHEDLAVGIAGWAAVAIDNGRLYQESRKALAEAQTANRLKDDFLATMSHELRTPLNAVLGWAAILRGGECSDQTRERAIETIERNARAQAQLVEDLLDVSRISSGKLQLEEKAVSLTELIEAVIESLRPAVEAKGVILDRTLDRRAAMVIGDEKRLRQVIDNLLSNALKFTPSGGRIDIGLERTEGVARLTVSDTGQGIAPDFLPHVFDRFRQADSSSTRAHGGLGLGLSIVQHLVELHRGTVRAHSAGPGRGATFTVDLPLDVFDERAPLGADGRIHRIKERPPGSSRALRDIHVLIVDDEPDSRGLMTDVLERHGAIVAAADSVSEAMALIRTTHLDIVVTDIAMPGADGYALADEIRTLRRPIPLPIVAVTAFAHPEQRQRILSAGFNAHLAKPFEAQDLIKIVAAAVAGNGSR